MSIQCQICKQQLSKYKCPKCAVRYCSLACFKNQEKHIHDESTVKEQKPIEKKPEDVTKQLHTPKYNEMLQRSDKLRELLQYNTVKFHLAKVYKILNAGTGALGSSDTQLSTEMKQQLAVDYLNTLRYGGIHYNEAVEEFCQICIELITEESQ
ncbi:LAFE_0C11496g1_1 [Lachancea fermentati]|uniref:LAFE_0C11496g1_1 n=1 Tax=Lachancea fermentati TaxID=4955 RepID=A0A1G4MAK5_LACFM|nr:LAFE_0C11496g1_1 [Lachancea fermentati]